MRRRPTGRQAGRLLAQAERRGAFLWASGADRHNVGFFTGLAGIGYTLLRYAEPDLLPSVLAFEHRAG